MFTGIIESLGSVRSIEIKGSNKTFWIGSPLSAELKIDQSVSHNGACLTVEEVSVTATPDPNGVTVPPPRAPHQRSSPRYRHRRDPRKNSISTAGSPATWSTSNAA
jgi:hypothetical protein